MSQSIYEKARTFIYHNARPIDLARWQYHFENGSMEAILKALLTYQNEDGGFGHTLEIDCWNPNSSPIHTWMATRILKEISFDDKNHPIIKGILKYLASRADYNGHFWYRTVPSNNDYPHAPWWHCDVHYDLAISYNPTASLAGFILCFAEKNLPIYQTALNISNEAISHYITEKTPEMHTVRCYMELIEYCNMASTAEIFEFPELKVKLGYDVASIIERDTSRWVNTYCCKPSFFIESKDSNFYPGNENLCDYECEFIPKTQQDNGAWKVMWLWNGFDKEYAISENWWQSNLIIENLLFLKAFDKLYITEYDEVESSQSE